MNQISLSSFSRPEHAPNTFLALSLSTTAIFSQSSGNTSLPLRIWLNFWNSVQHSSLFIFNHSLLPSHILPCHHLTASCFFCTISIWCSSPVCSFLHSYILFPHLFEVCVHLSFNTIPLGFLHLHVNPNHPRGHNLPLHPAYSRIPFSYLTSNLLGILIDNN